MRVHAVAGCLVWALVLSTSAEAADMPVKAPVYRAAPAIVSYNWTGFYIGGYAGYARGQSDFTLTPTGGWTGFPIETAYLTAVGTRQASGWGFTGGGQIGYNWQNGNLILGLESDFGSFRLNDGFDQLIAYPPGAVAASGGHIISSVETSWLLTARGRAGWAYDRLLLYATGGLAVTDLDVNATHIGVPATNVAAFNDSTTRAGWTAGGGAEWAFASNWSAKLEYLYMDFGSVSGMSTFNNDPRFTHDHSADLTAQVVRLGLNYRFGPDGTKY